MTITKNVTLTATSMTEGGTAIMTYHASISTKDANDITYNAAVINQSLYRANRQQCAADRAAFEDKLYEEQDSMIAAAREAE